AAGFDVPVDLGAKRAYVELWSPDQTYYADLGLPRPDGSFAVLSRSGAVHTPRAWPVAEVGESAAASTTAPAPEAPKATLVPEPRAQSPRAPAREAPKAPLVREPAAFPTSLPLPPPMATQAAPASPQGPAQVSLATTARTANAAEAVRPDSPAPVDAAVELH